MSGTRVYCYIWGQIMAGHMGQIVSIALTMAHVEAWKLPAWKLPGGS